MNHEELDSFAKRLQKISVDMSQNEVEELLGHPSYKFSHGEKAKDHDLYTFFSYELLLTEAPDSFYRITIIFSKNTMIEDYENSMIEKLVWVDIDESIHLYENMDVSPVARLVMNREIPILKKVKKILERSQL